MSNYLQYFFQTHVQLKLITVRCFSITSIGMYGVTLEEAIESALKADLTLRARKFNEMATEENIAIARSRLLPQISL